jgi:preprotein translocase subunit SecE
MGNSKKGKGAKGKAVAKTDSNATVSKSYFTPAGIREFTQEVRGEFNKIAWPERKVTLGLTGFVVVLVALISAYLGLVDAAVGKLFSLVLK